jgi:TatD DNase family protein
MTTTFIDVHAHFDMLEDGSPEATIELARAAGVSQIFTIGTEPNDHQYVLDIARKHFPTVVCTLGVHPHQAELYTSEVGDFIRKHIPEKEVVAIGEIGLDYYYKKSSVEAQKKAFREQLDLAVETNMPIEIHTRDAEADTVEILNDYKGRVKGLIHCFTGTQWLAEKGLDLGYNISFSGVVTFKNAESLREVCKYVPLDRIHVETDAPFLAPVPKRGQKNTPAFVVHTAQFIAQLKGISLEKLAECTNANARHLFPKSV